MDLPLPLQVIYAGLAGSLLALIVATIQQKWQLRVFVILALRLAIGWHFLFEGMNKIRSHIVGETLTSKPFSSEAYFREAEGPIAGYMQKQFLPDPEAKLIGLVIPVGDPKTVGDVLGSTGEAVLLEAYSKAGPETNHARLFTASPPAGMDSKVYFTKTVLALPLNGAGGSFLAEYPAATATAKTIDARVLELLPPLAREKFDRWKIEVIEAAAPEKKAAALQAWERERKDYANWCVGLVRDEVKKKYVSMDVAQSVPTRLADYAHRKTELANLIARRQVDLGRTTLFANIATAKAEVKSVREALVSDAENKLKDATTNLVKLAGVPMPADPAPEPSAIEAIDLQTMWMLTIAGALLIVGLLTRLAAIVCTVFLVMTYLTYPPFPWLPNPPGTEGNPVFVNKNLIEALGCLVIAAHPTGRWMGLDGFLVYLWNGRGK